MLAVFAALLVAGAPDAGTPPRFAWPMPGVIDIVDIPGEVIAGGIRTRLRRVRLQGKPEDLIHVYGRAFYAAGFHIAPPSHQPQMEGHLALTALDPVRRLSYSVLLSGNKDGTTHVLMGEANLQRLGEPEIEFAPLMAGARQVLRSQQEGWNLASYEVKARAAEVWRFYRESLAKAGFVEGDDALEKGTFVRASESLHVRVSEQDGGVSTVVLTQRLGR